MQIQETKLLNGVFTIKTQGCNLECKICNSPELNEVKDSKISWREAFKIIFEYKEQIREIIITGGEPTVHDNLIPFLKSIKELNIKTILKTNGTIPRVIKKIVVNNLVDYISIGIKAPFVNYEKVTRFKKKKENWNCIYKSYLLVQKSKIPLEIRIPKDLDLVSIENIKTITHLANKHTIQ